MNPQKIASLFSALSLNRKIKVLSCIVSLVVIFCLLTSFVVLKLNFVTILEDGVQIDSFTTVKSEQAELLTAAGLTVSEDDKVVTTLDGQNIRVEISRAFAVSIHTDKEILTVMAVLGDTVADVLAKAEVSYKENDRLSHELTDGVSPAMEITLVRCTTKTVTVTEPIAFSAITHESDAYYKGVTKVTQKGIEGEKTLTYTVVYENGKEVRRTLTNTEVTKKAQDQITLVGTKQRSFSSSFGQKMSAEELEGAKCITVEATAYCNTSDGGQVTALGKPTGFGIVAVDPRVIPLGSKLYITSADGSYVYGYCIAGDTGGAIKGHRVDLFLGSESECRAFGRRPMQVYILG